MGIKEVFLEKKSILSRKVTQVSELGLNVDPKSIGFLAKWVVKLEISRSVSYQTSSTSWSTVENLSGFRTPELYGASTLCALLLDLNYIAKTRLRAKKCAMTNAFNSLESDDGVVCDAMPTYFDTIVGYGRSCKGIEVDCVFPECQKKSDFILLCGASVSNRCSGVVQYSWDSQTEKRKPIWELTLECHEMDLLLSSVVK